ncbi:MAG TPA: DEAD/DEAH box helicase [Allosphingosinicella sp.]|jgi:SNF2 family DNA or RNA helicase|nr:DEAD/DEAH box helicase [Allosphingosinicella sp.]
MPTISLTFEPAEEVLIIHGVDAQLARNPLLAAFLRQHGATVDDQCRAMVPTGQDALSARYQAVSRLLDRLGIEVEAQGRVADALQSVEAEEARFEEFSARAFDIWHRQLDTEEFREFVAVVDRECPGRTFYRKQLLSAYHLAFAQNVCNFSVPGAGKTSIVYAAYAYLRALPDDDPRSIDRLLIVGPLSSFKAWEDEFKEIFGRKPNSRRISGATPLVDRSDHLRGISVGSRQVELTLTSYQTMANLEDDFRVFLSRGDPRIMMVLDEAHYIKSADGRQANSALRLAPLPRGRVILTGTPAPNGYEDLANLFRFLYPARNIVGFPAATLRAMSDGTMQSAVDQLRKRIQPFFTRIKKADLNLPLVSEERIEISMEPIQARIYRALERKIVPQIRAEFERPDGNVRVKARLIRLRQASVNPELLLKPLTDEGVFDTGGTGDLTVGEMDVADLIAGFSAETDLARLRVCGDIVRSVLEDQGKVLIWSYFLGNLDRLRRTFAPLAPFVEVLTGATPVAGMEGEVEAAEGTREAIIDGFHRAPGKAILIANPQAVGESISLHKACRTAIYFDRDFNAGRYIQSKDRIHRYNPEGGLPVRYIYLMSEGTVDDDIDTRLVIKEQRLTDLVDSDDIPLLTAASDEDGIDDIRAIFESYERRKTS